MDPEEKKKAIFEQNCEDFRSMNAILWQVPIIITTLTGGLWFGVGSIDISGEGKKWLLYLAATADFIFILVLFRLRYVMQSILADIKAYQQKAPSSSYLFVIAFSVLLGFSGGVSLYAACKGERFYGKKNPQAEARPDQSKTPVPPAEVRPKQGKGE